VTLEETIFEKRRQLSTFSASIRNHIAII